MANNLNFGLALEYVDDIEAATRFYVEVLGLEIERAAPVFVQFKEHFAIATDGSLDGRNELELYWLVDDAEAAYKELSRKGDIVLPLTEKPFGKVFGLKNPDGEPRYVLEFGQNRQSKPVQ